jgi:hypothetical protein
MQHGHVADRHVLSDRERKAWVGVQYRAVLNIAVGADGDEVVVGAHRAAEPDGRSRLDNDVADDAGGFGNECGRIDLRSVFTESIDGHGICSTGEASKSWLFYLYIRVAEMRAGNIVCELPSYRKTTA